MKSSLKQIRHYACGELLNYRYTYNICHRAPYVTDEQLEHLYNHYIMIAGIYACGLISSDTFTRAYYMYFNILYER